MRTNDKLIVKYWGWFHICFIMLICCYSTYHKYCRFNKTDESTIVKTINRALLANRLMSYYGRLSGTGAGYGFFAPQIKSTGLIIGDCGGQQVTADIKNFESMMRFGMMASHVTDYIISPEDSRIADTTMARKYYDLLFKSVAVKIYNQSKCRQDTLYMSYNILMFPSLAEYRENGGDYSLKKIKEIQIIKH